MGKGFSGFFYSNELAGGERVNGFRFLNRVDRKSVFRGLMMKFRVFF